MARRVSAITRLKIEFVYDAVSLPSGCGEQRDLQLGNRRDAGPQGCPSVGPPSLACVCIENANQFHVGRGEPPRFCRRPNSTSHAAMRRSFICA